jgi:hypothetical protein
MKHNRLKMETKTCKMLASDKEMAPQVLEHPGPGPQNLEVYCGRHKV